MMKELFYSFSEKTRYLRFHRLVKAFPHARRQVFCNVDYSQRWRSSPCSSPDFEEPIGVGRYLHDEANNTAEIAFVVRDDWQSRGIGRTIFGKLVEIGRERGIERFFAEVLPETSRCSAFFTIPTATCRRPRRVMWCT